MEAQITLSSFDKQLYLLTQAENSKNEMYFSTNMIDSLCKKGNYPCYSFSYNLEGHIYMRMRMKDITLEYLVIPNVKPQDYNAYVYQIFISGQRLYSRPDNPEKTIYLIWSEANS